MSKIWHRERKLKTVKRMRQSPCRLFRESCVGVKWPPRKAAIVNMCMWRIISMVVAADYKLTTTNNSEWKQAFLQYNSVITIVTLEIGLCDSMFSLLQTKFMGTITGTISLPHFFEDGTENRIVAFCKVRLWQRWMFCWHKHNYCFVKDDWAYTFSHMTVIIIEQYNSRQINCKKLSVAAVQLTWLLQYHVLYFEFVLWTKVCWFLFARRQKTRRLQKTWEPLLLVDWSSWKQWVFLFKPVHYTW